MLPQEETLGSVSTFDLITAFRRILERAREEEPGRVVEAEQVRLDDRVETILVRLGELEEVRFDELFGDDRRRIVLVVTFMALLELIKMQEVVFRQEEAFGTIFVSRRKQADREGPMEPQQPEPSDGQEPQS